MTTSEPRAPKPRGIKKSSLILWTLGTVALIQAAAIVHLELKLAELTRTADTLSGAAQVQLLTPAALLLANSQGHSGYDLEQLNRTRSASHAWLDGFIRQQGIAPSDATLLRALHDRFLGQRAEAHFNAAVGIYQPQDVAQLHQTLRERYAQAARSVLGEPVAAALMQGIDQGLPSWEPAL